MNRAAQYQKVCLEKSVLQQTVERQRSRIQELEKKVRRLEAQLAAATKTSVNSSKPPSSDVVKPKRGRGKGKGKIGGQKGHPRSERPAFTPEQIDHTVLHKLDACLKCGSRDLIILPEPGQVIQQAELVAKPVVVTEHRAEQGCCRACNAVSEAPLPEAVRRTGLTGPRLLALLLFVKGALHVSYSGLQEFLDQVLGLRVCRGYLAKVLTRKAVAALTAPVAELVALLPSQSRLNVDETGHKENKRRLWTWCFRAPGFVVFRIQESRGSEVLIDLLGVEFSGVLGCDYFSAYRKFMGQMSGLVQFCLAHLVRDLKFLAEHPQAGTQIYGQGLLRAVGRLFALIHDQVERPAADFLQRMERQKEHIIQLGSDTTVVSPIASYVAQAHPEVANMARRFNRHGAAYFTFITTPGMDPTNNSAEQAIRFIVIDRLVTQGTRSPIGRRFCEHIWTVIGTRRLQGRSVFRFFWEAVQAWANGLPPPSLVPDALNPALPVDST